jgi:hypothetical protein
MELVCMYMYVFCVYVYVCMDAYVCMRMYALSS